MSASQPEKTRTWWIVTADDGETIAVFDHDPKPLEYAKIVPVVEQAALAKANEEIARLAHLHDLDHKLADHWQQKLAAETARADRAEKRADQAEENAEYWSARRVMAEARVKELERWEPAWRAPKAKP